MLTIDVINDEINNIVQHGNNYTDCERLANLYICKAGLSGSVSAILPTVSETSSEFVTAACRSPDCWAVLDELMEVLKVLNPSLYAGVIDKLNR